MRKFKRWAIFLFVLGLGFVLPETRRIPVAGAAPADWNPKAFWHYPWGASVVHRGIDIFAREGTTVQAATGGLVLYAGELARGGRVVLVLGSKWRLHYYAHLQRSDVAAFRFVASGAALGTVGSTGNAQGKPPHLHYSIISPLPMFHRYGFGMPLGWLRMFYLDPHAFLTARNE